MSSLSVTHRLSVDVLEKRLFKGQTLTPAQRSQLELAGYHFMKSNPMGAPLRETVSTVTGGAAVYYMQRSGMFPKNKGFPWYVAGGAFVGFLVVSYFSARRHYPLYKNTIGSLQKEVGTTA